MITNLRYADDIILLATSEAELQELVAELTTGRVGSGHVVVNVKICTFSYLTLKESLLLLILSQGDGIDKRHSATSRLRH